MMKPIVFSTPMVEATLADLKSQTRRLNGLEEINKEPDKWKFSKMFEYEYFDGLKGGYAEFEIVGEDTKKVLVATPRYQPGDVLWVREKLVKGVGVLVHYADGTIVTSPDKEPDFWHIKWKWKRDTLPAIFMPRYAARIFLEVLKVRVERLQDIKERDIEAEGVELANPYEPDYAMNTNEIFVKLWNSLHGKGAWDLNPFVFVYEFGRSECQP